MKFTVIAMLAIVAALICAAAWKGGTTLGEGFQTSGTQFLKFIPVLIVAFLIMGFVDLDGHRLLSIPIKVTSFVFLAGTTPAPLISS